MSVDSLWARLAADDLVEGERPEDGQPASPWFVRVMLGIAGWIGALFLLAFVGAAFAFIMNDSSAAFILGAVCCTGAFVLLRTFAGNDFADQFGLVVSLVGQGMMIVGLGQMLEADGPALFFAVAALEAGLAVAVPNFLHRLLASCGAAIALALGIVQLSIHGVAAPVLCVGLALIWLEPRRWAAAGKLWRPVGYGLVLALLLIETFRLVGADAWFGMRGEPPGWGRTYGPIGGRILTAATLVWVAVELCRREGFPAAGRTALSAAAAALLFGLVSLKAPGLASAMLVLLLGFAAGSRLLLALGILGLLGFVTHFYYSLDATLLEKSGLLALTGLGLLAAHFVLRRGAPAAPASEEPGHA